GIRHFVWEHAEVVNRILTRVELSGGTFNGPKMVVFVPKVIILGQLCSYEGRHPEPSKVAKIRDWP
ncbi:hypothetical protein CALCODRAFT_420609, partial [Calocera cornea HHB12733]